jgi:hypothetical protein
VVTRNKARLVAQGFTQVEGICTSGKTWSNPNASRLCCLSWLQAISNGC